MFTINKKIGEEKNNKFGSKIIITSYKSYHNINVYFPEYNWTAKNITYESFKKGTTKCPYEPRTYNKGYIGEGKYKSTINKKIYSTWIDMLERCYSEKHHKKQWTYKDCEVCDEWLNFQNFAKWFEENYYKVKDEKMCLDKDILVKGNKLYSPKTCIFVPNSINILFVKSNKIRGDLPIGVSLFKRDNIYQSYLSINNRHKHLGRFDNINDAFNCYKQAKEKYIKEVADEYKDKIPKKLYNAMYKYEVEITD